MLRKSCLLFLVACAAILYAEETPPVELQYWTSPLVIRTMGEIFERYEREHPGVKVVIGQAAARNLVERLWPRWDLDPDEEKLRVSAWIEFNANTFIFLRFCSSRPLR